MPQLILKPWFLIFLFSWMIFLTIIPSKVMKHYFNNEPKTINTHKLGAETWSWTWH